MIQNIKRTLKTQQQINIQPDLKMGKISEEITHKKKYRWKTSI